MATVNDIINKRKQDAKKREPKRDISYGTTIAVDYENSPQVANRKGFVWIMEKGNNHAFQCYNASVPLAVGMPVRIMRDANIPSRRVVQGVDYDALGATINSPDPGKSLSVPNHHRNHEFLPMFPGLDVVNVYSRAIVPLKIYPGSTALTICVMPGDYEVDQTHKYYPGLVDDDISGQVPTTAGNYVSCLVFLDSATNLVGYLNGTEGVGMYPTEPDVPDGDIPLGYVRLHNGMTGVLTETEVTNDPRPFISIATGGGGGGGTPATTVTDETTWGITPAVGSDTEYARQDHTHGTPPTPSGAGDILQSGSITVGHQAIFTADHEIGDGGAPGSGSTDVLQVQVFS